MTRRSANARAEANDTRMADEAAKYIAREARESAWTFDEIEKQIRIHAEWLMYRARQSERRRNRRGP